VNDLKKCKPAEQPKIDRPFYQVLLHLLHVLFLMSRC
jgi:hypothetical protein